MQPAYHEFFYPGAHCVNAAVTSRFEALLHAGEVRKTHLFAGRYENLYIEREEIPALQQLIPFWLEAAADVLHKQVADLRCGFWFNQMGPGDVTQAHSHDDYDEKLSGVYYLHVPKESGDLILHQGDQRQVIQPQAGLLLLFSSSAVHEVSENFSQETRLSIGINFGLKGVY